MERVKIPGILGKAYAQRRADLLRSINSLLKSRGLKVRARGRTLSLAVENLETYVNEALAADLRRPRG